MRKGEFTKHTQFILLFDFIQFDRSRSRALVLASPEIRFQVDSETQDPIEVEVKKMRETNSMVEEFMLLANISVAEKIENEFPEFAMLRRHPEPPQTNFEPLIKAGKHLGFDIDTSSGKQLAESLDNAVRKDNPYFNTMLRILATRCMMQAVYFISGTVQKDEFFHYGLAAPIYTHFTSPIRRYDFFPSKIISKNSILYIIVELKNAIFLSGYYLVLDMLI